MPNQHSSDLGDVIELVGSSDNGLLEGMLRGTTGYFARELVQVSSPHLQFVGSICLHEFIGCRYLFA